MSPGESRLRKISFFTVVFSSAPLARLTGAEQGNHRRFRYGLERASQPRYLARCIIRCPFRLDASRLFARKALNQAPEEPVPSGTTIRISWPEWAITVIGAGLNPRGNGVKPNASLSPDELPRGPLSPDELPRGPLSPDELPRGPLSPDELPRGPLSPDELPRGPLSPLAPPPPPPVPSSAITTLISCPGCATTTRGFVPCGLRGRVCVVKPNASRLGLISQFLR